MRGVNQHVSLYIEYLTGLRHKAANGLGAAVASLMFCIKLCYVIHAADVPVAGGRSSSLACMSWSAQQPQQAVQQPQAAAPAAAAVIVALPWQVAAAEPAVCKVQQHLSSS
jgi:hypothetical protein